MATPSSETVTYDASKMGGLHRRLPAFRKRKHSLTDRLTQMRASGAFGPRKRVA